MSIFQITDKRIPEGFLKKRGFKKIRWGSPLDGTDEGRTVWEKICGEGADCCVFWYFPNEFDGYVNCRSRRLSGGTRGMRNHVIAQLQRRRWEGSYTDKVYDASDMSDILMVFEDYNNYTNK